MIKRLVYVPIIIMLIVGALMIGITDYITGDLNFSKILKADFLINLITTNIGIICIIISILLFKVDKFKLENEEYLKTLSNINNFKNSEAYSQPVFNKFAKEENKQEKRDVYIKLVQNKWNKLNPSAKDLEIYNSNDEKAKLKNKYCKKAKRLEILMSKDYVDKNIDKLHVKYNTITPALIFSGVVTTSKSRKGVTKNKGKKVFLDLLPKFLLSFAITALIASSSFDFKDGITVAMVIKTASKIFTICSQIYFAINYADRFNEEVTLCDIDYRWGVITSFKLWIVKQIEKPKKEIIPEQNQEIIPKQSKINMEGVEL